MPLMRASDLSDRNDVTLPSATRRSFWLNGSAWDFPDFENAETFVQRLVQAGLIVADRPSREWFAGSSKMSRRAPNNATSFR